VAKPAVVGYQWKSLFGLVALFACGGPSRPETTSLSTAPSIAQPSMESPSPVTSTTVYVTKSGAKYHRAGCRYLRNGSIPTALGDAAKAHTPCSVCKPPLK